MSLIIVLRNITIADLERSLANEDETQTCVARPSTYQALPGWFTCVADWPTTTALKCRICDQMPRNYPRMIATNRFYDAAGNVIYAVTGPFHDWCCAAAYIDIYHAHHRAELHLYLAELEEMFSGERKVKIPAAYSKFLLRQYAGDEIGKTIEEWNRMNDQKTARETIIAPL